MPPVTVIILHSTAPPGAGALERIVAAERLAAARRLERRFGDLGADAVGIVAGPPDGLPFGRRLAGLLPSHGGVVVVGSGSAPLAADEDLRPFVAAARAEGADVLANNRYSSDLVAIPRAGDLPPLPDLPADNALPRWLEEVAGRRVGDLRGRWRLQVDLDGPLDLVLTGAGAALGALSSVALARLGEVRDVLSDRRSEAVVAGRTSSASLRWLERHAASRIRALVEERGLRASTGLARADAEARAGIAARPARPPRSVLGLLLDREGPAALGPLLAELGDAALVDTRVLLAHRLGPDERAWPSAEDRFASDLLLADSIGDPWLRDLTASACSARIPLLLGGHSLVGPGIRLVLPAARPDLHASAPVPAVPGPRVGGAG